MDMESKKKLIIEKIEEWSTIFFFCTGNFVLISLTQALLLMWLNQFKIAYILISLFISFLSTIIFLRFIKNDIKLIPHLNLAVLSVIFLISLILILFPHDNLGGRDEGYYSGMAVMLARNNNLSIPSYLYGAPLDKSSAFLTTPTYVVWLATQKVLFGLQWMLKSNVVLIFLGLCSLFLVSSLITKKSLGFITVLLFSTCMPFLWFSRETMTENMAFFLLWFLILSLFLFIKTKKNYFLVSLFFSSWLFSFTREEGLFIQIPVLILLTTILLIRKIVPKKKIFFISIVYIFLIVLSFFIKNRILPLNKNLDVAGSLINLKNYMPKTNIVTLGERIPVFVFQMLSKQNLSLALYSFPLVMTLIIASKKKIVKDKIFYICLLGVLSLEFTKLINPSVNFFQPWFYRRYLYALLPFGYLNLSILLNRYTSRKILVFLTGIFFVINIILSSKIIFLKNNWFISKEIEKLTQNISTKDFVSIDGVILKEYFPSSYLTFHKETRNLYNYWIIKKEWDQKEKKYLGLTYNKMFLLTDKELQFYENFQLKKVRETQVIAKQLIPNCVLWDLSRELGLAQLKLYVTWIPYEDALAYCKKTDNELIEINKKIFLYEMIYNE